MILDFGNEGEKIDLEFLKDNGFHIDLSKDATQDKSGYNFNFVGALVNSENDLFVIFPKHYIPTENLENDFMIVFDIIRNKNNSGSFSIDSAFNTDQCFPFNEFFKIYGYFEKFGLPIDEFKYVTKTPNGKINWKASISKSQKLISNGKFVLWELFYDKNFNRLNVLAECMIIAINYTIEKFGFILNVDNIPSQSNILHNFEFEHIANLLYNIKNLFFKDIEIDLIDNLINFFSKISRGYTCYFKEYYFNNIWEDMVEYFLNSKSLYVPEYLISTEEFKKTRFYFESLDCIVDEDISFNRVLDIDHFCIDHDSKVAYIFDSKYKNNVVNLDYKQVVYWLFIRDYLDLNNMSDYKIECCLVAPTKNINFEFKKHLYMEKGVRLKNISISELYIDTKWLVDFYSK